MVEFIATLTVLLAAPFAALVAAVVGRRRASGAARSATAIVTVGWLTAVAIVLLHLLPRSVSALRVDLPGFSIDPLAAVMLLLVLGLSALIQHFAVRYLRGDSRQVWFVVTANLVTGATALMVSASTIASFTIAWVLAGFALLALLNTYPTLPQARDGVRRTALRLLSGDVALLVAITTLAIAGGGNVALDELRETVTALPPIAATIVALLLVLPALARSSQIPFHGWLPATLAAPTPVSALMHAGIVNAGAILLLRFSPAVATSTAAMIMIFSAGALTLSYASVVRLVKPDVKGRLVFSTMAQMGFMILACGLGAFGAAVFHLVAHGMFKSALFLGAGRGVSREALWRSWPQRSASRWPRTLTAFGFAGAVSIAAITIARITLQAEVPAANQALQLFAIFTATLALAAALRVDFSVPTAALGAASIIVLAFGYTAVVDVFDQALDVPFTVAAVNPLWLGAPAFVLLVLPGVLRGWLPAGLAHRAYARVLALGTPLPPTTTLPAVLVKGASA